MSENNDCSLLQMSALILCAPPLINFVGVTLLLSHCKNKTSHNQKVICLCVSLNAGNFF